MPESIAPGPVPTDLTVNGHPRTAVGDPDSPLLLALRDELGLNGPKVGCALSQCGVCTVLRDGEPIRSCVTPVGEAAGTAITTVEGLAPEGRLHPVQRAFLDERAAQCGYCIPGIMIVAASLLVRTPDPTDGEIADALSGNLCRCGAHVRILRAIRRAARMIAADPQLAIDGLPLPAWTPATTQPPAHVAPERRLPPGERLNPWLHVVTDGTVMVLSGKVELGTGVRTALSRVVADGLGLAPERVGWLAADTAITPDQGTTAGSKTLQSSVPLLREAVADARATLLDRAADRLAVPPRALTIADGMVRRRDGRGPALPFAALLRPGGAPETDAPAEPPTHPMPDGSDVAPETGDQHPIPIVAGPGEESAQRVDLLAKLTGAPAYVHDLRLPGMLHARVIRPMARTVDGMAGRHIVRVDQASVSGLPGVVAVIRDGDVLAVVAERDAQALAAARALRVEWSAGEPLSPFDGRFAALQDGPSVPETVQATGDPDAAIGDAKPGRALSRTYRHPWQAHASIGPSCAVADVRPDGATVWCASQGVFGLRAALAPVLGLPEEAVRIVHMEGPGCYGHNGADDVAADAASISQRVGRPVRLIWSRQGEFAWEGKGPAMLSEVRAALGDDGRIAAWAYDVWTPTHSTRPGGQPGNLLAGQTRADPVPFAPLGRGGGTRNALSSYVIPEQRVTAHWVMAPALRPSALRSLGGMANTTANETMIGELAELAGADPVAFRLRHLDDARAAAVLEGVSRLAGWRHRPAGPAHHRAEAANGTLTGHGVAFARYETAFAYVAVVAEVTVAPATGLVRVTRVAVSHDCGEVIDADGVRNQVEGCAIQGISRALLEEVTWDADGVTALDWDSYPILGFDGAPEIAIDLIDRPGEPVWGAGEGAICPVPAAIIAAVHDATGVWLRQLPLTPERVRAAIAVGPDRPIAHR